MNAPAGEVAAAYGPWGLIAFTILAIITGRLLPRSTVEDIRTELAYARARVRELEASHGALATEATRLGADVVRVAEEVTQ